MLIWPNLSFVITTMIHCPCLKPLSHHSSVLTPALAPLRGLPSLAPLGPLSGNQAGRTHFSAHIILAIIANEYELPSAGHTRRESGRERGGGHRVSLCCADIQTSSCITHLHEWSGIDMYTRAHIRSSDKVTTSTGSAANAREAWER